MAEPPPSNTRGEGAGLTIDDRRLLAALRARRLELARAARRPARMICSDAVLAEIAARRPRDAGGLAAIEGFRADDIAHHGADLLEVVRRHENAVSRP